MKKKLLSLLLTLCLVMALVPMTAFAAETMDTWDGTAEQAGMMKKKQNFICKQPAVGRHGKAYQ